MRVMRAEHAGACYGVQRALDIARAQAARGGDVKSLGPLIHNPQVVAELEAGGVSVLRNVPDRFPGTIVVRSHGVGPQAKRRLEASGARIADATCPHVLRAQKAATELARSHGYVIVIGDPQHPEVEAIRAFAQEAGGEVHVVDDVDAIPADLPERVGIVVQTTQNRAVYDRIVAAVARRGVRADIKDTICSATSKRQQAAAELARQVDAMVVIGGHNSSNTTRLYEICKDLCENTHHVETVDELDAALFAGCGTVGVTAGASTPENQIVPVVEYLERL